MPKPVCIRCNSKESLLWRPAEKGQICNDCFIGETSPQMLAVNAEHGGINGVGVQQKPPLIKPATAAIKPLRKSTRSTRFKLKNTSTYSRPAIPKGRGRRSLSKKTPHKAPSTTAKIVTSDTIYFKGSYMQAGDIVSMLDEDDDTYYAQIRCFMTDQYCEKSAVVTWLLPTQSSPPPSYSFDPATYIIGPEEELPRKLDCMEFIMHAPSDYYKSTTTPYPLVDPGIGTINDNNGFIWASMDPKDRR